MPVNSDNKAEQEKKLLDLVRATGADLVLLARYMQALPDKLSERLDGKVIDIHGSFQPSLRAPSPTTKRTSVMLNSSARLPITRRRTLMRARLSSRRLDATHAMSACVFVALAETSKAECSLGLSSCIGRAGCCLWRCRLHRPARLKQSSFGRDKSRHAVEKYNNLNVA
ncbi:formyltransferase family protein [Mesorhizobium sp. WSM4976]|uniref:formyltransferase family protein n=1 Tax=Mesorhizobium sp. WSM4976 TaxID=3038549 RepID=UPI0032423E04